MMEQKITYRVGDIAERYRVSKTVAYKIMREIRAYTNCTLPVGRCLVAEAEAWERRNINGNRQGMA